jgi:hypothetical protein
MVATPVLDARGVVVLPALYAHRLGRVPGPDSSRAALQATLSAPVDGLETDVCLTAVGVSRCCMTRGCRRAPRARAGRTRRPGASCVICVCVTASAGCRLSARCCSTSCWTQRPWAWLCSSTLAAWARPVGVQGVCIEHFLVHAALVDQLRGAGLSVTTGTINDVELARRVARLGVDAITTDVPAQLWTVAEGAAHAPDRSTARIRG